MPAAYAMLSAYCLPAIRPLVPGYTETSVKDVSVYAGHFVSGGPNVGILTVAVASRMRAPL